MKYFDLPFLKEDLHIGATIQVSLTPGVPGLDEQINHEVISCDFKETKSGLLLLMELKNKENKESYVYAFPDIQNIEMHSHASKYYLYSIDRGKLSDHTLSKSTKLLNEKKYTDDMDIFEDAPRLVNRIIIIKQ